MLGFIVPRLMIKGYGSDVNGLVNTVTQIFTYMALLEAGIGQAARNALYKPFANKNQEEISTIASSAQHYYRRITVIYGFAVIALSALLPYIIISDVPKLTIFLIVIFQGFANVIVFYFVQTKSIILQVDGKGYIAQTVTVVNKTASYAAQIGLALMGVSIVFLQVAHDLLRRDQTAGQKRLYCNRIGVDDLFFHGYDRVVHVHQHQAVKRVFCLRAGIHAVERTFELRIYKFPLRAGQDLP